MGYQKALSLYAVSMDRLLIRQGKKQRFATQYFKKNDASSWKLLPFDKKMSDKERKKYNVPPLAETRKMINQLNKHE